MNLPEQARKVLQVESERIQPHIKRMMDVIGEYGVEVLDLCLEEPGIGKKPRIFQVIVEEF